jgi:hypothetical protein
MVNTTEGWVYMCGGRGCRLVALHASNGLIASVSSILPSHPPYPYQDSIPLSPRSPYRITDIRLVRGARVVLHITCMDA